MALEKRIAILLGELAEVRSLPKGSVQSETVERILDNLLGLAEECDREGMDDIAERARWIARIGRGKLSGLPKTS